MLKMALFDCAINEKSCSVDGGRGICPLFSSRPRGIWQLKSPHPREFAIWGKKKCECPGVSPGGAGRRWNWLMPKMQDEGFTFFMLSPASPFFADQSDQRFIALKLFCLIILGKIGFSWCLTLALRSQPRVANLKYTGQQMSWNSMP